MGKQKKKKQPHPDDDRNGAVGVAKVPSKNPRNQWKKKEDEKPPEKEDVVREYEKDGVWIKELGFSGGKLGIRCNLVERDGHRYAQLTNWFGQSMTVYDDQLDWLVERLLQLKSWKPEKKEIAA